MASNRKRQASESEESIWGKPQAKKPKIYLKFKNQPQIKPSQRASDIVAAIYWDINDICSLQTAMWKKGDTSRLLYYLTQCDEARNLMRIAVDFKLRALTRAEKDVREVRNIARSVRNLGWKMVAICAYTEAFRRACAQETDEAVWTRLLDLMIENRASLVYFARMRNLDWRGLLLRYSNHPIPKLKQHLKWVHKSIGKEHSHHYAQMMTGVLRRSTYRGRLVENIEECAFDPAYWTERGQQLEDPTLREERHGRCDLCDSRYRCHCSPGTLVAGLIELVEYADKGIGVRALTNFKKGELLAEYVGELRFADDDDDPYGLYLQTNVDDNRIIASISAETKGNWSRFINHSCNASTAFLCRTIGTRVRMTVEALRDIPIFEEITIDYGNGYWLRPDIRCQCGEPNCRSEEVLQELQRRQKAQEARTARRVMAVKAKEAKAARAKAARAAKEKKAKQRKAEGTGKSKVAKATRATERMVTRSMARARASGLTGGQ